MAIAATRVVEEVTPCRFVIERRAAATVGGIHHNELVTVGKLASISKFIHAGPKPMRNDEDIADLGFEICAEQCLRARIDRRRNETLSSRYRAAH
jgi:hypothetical protein